MLQSIYQSFDGQALYPSIEEKAVQLLFSIIKNHPFLDGNKKIGAFLFLRFLAKNNCLYYTDGSKKIDDATVVAITLLVATCNPDDKDMITKLILNFLAKKE
ncbi:MAG: Fic family protein [bacterium]